MPRADSLRIGYVLKRYPRYSETFIVREILAHEQAGVEIEIFSLRPCNDGHFQNLIARVRGRVNYLYFPADGLLPEALSAASLTASHFWRSAGEAASVQPDLWSNLGGDPGRRSPLTSIRHWPWPAGAALQDQSPSCSLRQRGERP